MRQQLLGERLAARFGKVHSIFNQALNLGLVDAKWSVEEYTATFTDDDAQYVGAIDQHGLFTPSVDGPNPKRRNQ